MQGNLSGLGGKHLALDADDIAHIQLFKAFVRLLTDGIPGHIALNLPLQILYMTERSLAHHPFAHHTAGNAYLAALQGFVIILDFLTVVRNIVGCYGKRILSGRHQLRQLLTAYSQQVVQILFLILVLISHGKYPRLLVV